MPNEKERQLAFLDHSLQIAKYKASKEQFDHAIAHLNDAKQSLDALLCIQNKEEANHQVDLQIKQIEGGIHYKELLRRINK